MATVHIAGPVVGRRTPVKGWVAHAYQEIMQSSRDLNLEAMLPEAKPELEAAEPDAFVEWNRQKIDSSDIVITVFAHDDVSAGVEAGMAALLGKQQLIVAEDVSRVPRMLRGLPGIVGVLPAGDRRALSQGIRSFMRTTRPSPGYAY
jgi:nucleoside 2-deoxyribosyltransferase